LPASLARSVRTHAVFGHDALHHRLTSCLEERNTFLLYMVAQRDVRPMGQDKAEDLFSTEERKPGQIEAVEMEKIEYIIDEPALCRLRIVLEHLKAGPSRFVHHHDLSVEKRVE